MIECSADYAHSAPSRQLLCVRERVRVRLRHNRDGVRSMIQPEFLTYQITQLCNRYKSTEYFHVSPFELRAHAKPYRAHRS